MEALKAQGLSKEQMKIELEAWAAQNGITLPKEHSNLKGGKQ